MAQAVRKKRAVSAPKNARAKSTVARKKAKRLSWFDRFIRTLPFSPEEVQKGFTWLVLLLALVALLFMARWFELPQMAYRKYADLAAEAGFEVKRVEVVGMDRVDQLKVYDIVLAEKDRAMPLVDADKIRTDLLKYGWIKEVEVSRRLPDLLSVNITERKPSAIWQVGTRLLLVDSEGTILETVKGGQHYDLPMLIGEQANKHSVALSELLANTPSLKPQISGAAWVGNRRWNLNFKSGETLALPEGEELAAQALVKFARMDGITRLLGRDMIYFDMRDPARFYVRKAPKIDAVPETKKAPDASNKSKTDDVAA
jgi:cell division protein FtsQ